MARKTLIECEDYKCAVEKLSTEAVVAPLYYIIAGIGENEGAVISKNRVGADHIDYLSERNWFLL